MSEQQWTPERHAWARQLADRKDGDVQILLGYALDHIESQRLELEAARRVVDAIKVTTLKFPLPMLIEHALDQYHALRSQRATSGEDAE